MTDRRDVNGWLPGLIGPTIRINGEPLGVRRSYLNFEGSVDEVDDPDNNATTLVVAGTPQLQANGVDLPRRTVINFTGGVVDNPTEGRLDVATVEVPDDLAHGDVLFYDGGTDAFLRIPIGTEGQVLTVIGGVPAWAASSGGGPVFDPADLAPTGWWKPNYTGSPWVGAVGGNLTESTNPPATGTAVNGKTPADFNGGGLTNDFLLSSLTFDDLFGGADSAGIMLAVVDAIPSNDVSPNTNAALLSTSGSARLQVVLRSAGTVGLMIYDNAAASPECIVSGMTTGTLHAIHWRHTGTHIQIGIDGSWGTAVAAGVPNAGNAAFNFAVGRNVPETRFTDFKLLEFLTFDKTLDDDDVSGVIDYFNATYGLSL